MKIQESGENYLETILVLENRNGSVRSIDVAEEMRFSKPSVSRAVGILRQAGLITVGEGGYLCLTEEGRRKASAVYDRHCMLRRFLCRCLGVSRDNAEKDACRIEHVICEETFEKIKELAMREEPLEDE